MAHRKTGLAVKSLDWIDRASAALWKSTEGEISHRTVTTLRESVLAKYTSPDSHSKVLSFVVGFLKFLAKTRMEPRYTYFEVFLEMPRAVKERKSMTERIVTKDDIKNVLGHIKQAEHRGDISTKRSAQYSTFSFSHFLIIARVYVSPFRPLAAKISADCCNLNDCEPVGPPLRGSNKRWGAGF